jgi:hypothetical protein
MLSLGVHMRRYPAFGGLVTLLPGQAAFFLYEVPFLLRVPNSHAAGAA